ncbi:MAG: hypothetical protein M3X11_01925 [Acidobacteriota bacterium]|nr:hypothetical protein [Acidobacteriota bacterium]
MPKEEIEQDFPKLAEDGWRIASEIDPAYNCIAFAVRDTDQFWDPRCVGIRGYYWPPGIPREDTIQAWIRVFEIHSFKICDDGILEPDFEKLAIYTDSEVIPSHVARQLPAGQWIGKLGKFEDIEHNTPEGLESDTYGMVSVFMKRRIKQT